MDLNVQWLNALFNRDYDNIMNRVIDYVKYSSGSTSNNDVGDGCNTNDNNNDDYDDDDYDDDN